MSELSNLAVKAAKNAGAAINSLCLKKLKTKDDGSPLTLADMKAHDAVLADLAESDIAVVSEEGGDLRMNETTYWLVDPLDGTKDFLAGNSEFTVNIALIVNQVPVLGVIYAPELDELYAGELGAGAWCEKNNTRSPCHVAEKSCHCKMAVSRFHDHPDVDLFAAANNIQNRVAVGSALKYAKLAMAAVDVFPRLVGSSEWDTAAGQAVLEAVGGQVLDWHTGVSLRYGKPNRRNPRLLAFRAPYTLADFKLQSYPPELL